MKIFHILVAYMLLSFPCDNDPHELQKKFGTWLTKDVCEQIVEICIENEWMDVRERQYSFKDERTYHIDLGIFRRRYENLHDAPRDGERHRFPSAAEITDLLMFNRKYREYLVTQRNLANPHEKAYYDECISETDELYKIWDLIKDSMIDYYYISNRRLAMKQIIEKIGYANFYNGIYPPHVPIWRFSRAE